MSKNSLVQLAIGNGIIILIIFYAAHAVASVSSEFENRFNWMNAGISALGSGQFFPSCIEVPVLTGVQQSSTSIDIENNAGRWISTGVRVQKDKLLKFEWNSSGVRPRPAKYKVIYRVDPRFIKPQIFIQTYDYNQKKYISDFHHFKDGVLAAYQQDPNLLIYERIADFLAYFNFTSRPKIPINKDDVINISLDKSGTFFGANTEMSGGELGAGSDFRIIYTGTSAPENKIMYMSSASWCSTIVGGSNSNNYCNNGNFYDTPQSLGAYIGKINNSSYDSVKSSLPACPDGADTMLNNMACAYDKGRGMKITIGAKTIKNTADKFMYSSFTGKDFLYYKSDSNGSLDFTTDWQIEGMYNMPQQFMQNWQQTSDPFFFYLYLMVTNQPSSMNFLHFGRYVMNIEVGSSTAVVSDVDQNAIGVEYVILDNGTPTESTSGNLVDRRYSGNAYSDGYVWLRAVNPSPLVAGTVNVKMANYTGNKWFSDVVYKLLVKPLRENFNRLTEIMYRKFVSNPILQNIAKTMLTLYIMVYSLMFLAGATKISVLDIVTRTLKIGVIVALFSEKSWQFFNNNLFIIFVEGTDYLMSSVVGTTSEVGNIFGFVDPIVDKYTNPTVWGLLGIQLLNIHNGVTFFAIMTIHGIIIYFRAVIEVVVSYCLAFLGIAVMISLAPFFILMMLFEKTKSMFDNWLSTLFSYMIQPTMLLVFFLLIDQMMSQHLANTIMRSCWAVIIPLDKIVLDLLHIDLPMEFSLPIPFLPGGIPFYTPQYPGMDAVDQIFTSSPSLFKMMTSTLIFYAYCKLARGLVEYVTLVVQYLTNVLPARQEGELRGDGNPVRGIIGDMQGVAGKITSPVTGAISSVGGFIKDKVLDQKITHRDKGGLGGNPDYSKINRTQKDGNEQSTLTETLKETNETKEEQGTNKSEKPKAKITSVDSDNKLSENNKKDNDDMQSSKKDDEKNIQDRSNVGGEDKKTSEYNTIFGKLKEEGSNFRKSLTGDDVEVTTLNTNSGNDFSEHGTFERSDLTKPKFDDEIKESIVQEENKANNESEKPEYKKVDSDFINQTTENLQDNQVNKQVEGQKDNMQRKGILDKGDKN